MTWPLPTTAESSDIFFRHLLDSVAVSSEVVSITDG